MRISTTALALLCCISGFGQSVLTSGSWYKVGVTERGVYKIDRDFLVRELKINSSIDPQTIQIFGIAGGMLPQANSIARPSDPVEIPVFASGETDQSLDAGDYFLFYADGPDAFYYSDGEPVFEKNLYSDTAYYFITHSQTAGKRISSESSPTSTSTVLTSFSHLVHHELDETNQLRSGRDWLGESFRRSGDVVLNFTAAAPNATGPVKIWLDMAASSDAACSFSAQFNSDVLGDIDLEAIPSEQYDDKLTYNNSYFESSSGTSSNTLKLTFTPSSSGSSVGYLDKYTLAFTSTISLSTQNPIMIFESDSAAQTYQISGYSSASQIWDVSDPLTPVVIIPSANSQFTTKSTRNNVVILDGNDFDTPQYLNTIANQNLKAKTSHTAFIISHPDFLTEAQELADYHQTYDGISVAVITPGQIYNEFSAGRQDLSAIRDFFKYCYDNGGSIQYALLMGDASYDYKYRVSPNTNYVPTYESRESSNNLYSYCSDDFFAFLEDSEGYWQEDYSNPVTGQHVYGQDHTMDIGIGRLPVKTADEASQLVDKILRYKTSRQGFGKWRNQLAYFADDGDSNEHASQAEAFCDLVNELAPEYSETKLFLDKFDQTDGDYSEVVEAIYQALDDGVFMFNYVGHGNETQLTAENIINISMIREMANRNKLPFFVTATCEFGRYDIPSTVSGAERILLNENGGGVAIFSTTRPVYANTNFTLNTALHNNLFRKTDGSHPRLGDVIRLTKNASLKGSINRNFTLLGDPMLQLSYPEYDISFDQLESETDTLSALENYYLSGRIEADGQLVSDFNGEAILTLYDIPQTKETLGQESDPFEYTEQTNALFRGTVTVTNGLFESNFILPKNMSYKYQSGKITMYAWNETSTIDASGASQNFVLGGTSSQTQEDVTGPEMSLYMNQENFRNGGTVGPNSVLVAQISDSNGINLSNDGLTAGVTLQLNDDAPIDVSAYYTSSTDDFTSGSVIYPFQNLDAGTYTATLKVLDTYNNATTATVQFKVSDGSVIRLYNASCYPNPVSSVGNINFSFEHDRPDEQLEIGLFLYNTKGQNVRKLNFTIESDDREILLEDIPAYDHHGVPLTPGVYIYRLVVTSTLDNATNEIVKRLIVIN